MTDEEVAVKLKEHDEKLKVANNRIKDLEEQQKQIQELTYSVKDLAVSVRDMADGQNKISERVSVIEMEPVKKCTNAKQTLFNSLLGAIGSALGIGIIYLLYVGVNGGF